MENYKKWRAKGKYVNKLSFFLLSGDADGESVEVNEMLDDCFWDCVQEMLMENPICKQN